MMMKILCIMNNNTMKVKMKIVNNFNNSKLTYKSQEEILAMKILIFYNNNYKCNQKNIILIITLATLKLIEIL